MTHRTLFASLYPFLALASAACSVPVGTAPVESSAAQLAASEPARDHGAPRHEAPAEHRRGDRRAKGSKAARLLRAAGKDPTLSEEQRAKLAGIERRLADGKGGAKEASQALRATLARAVVDGKLEDGEVAEARERLLAERRAASLRDAEALNELHAALTPAQRQSLVLRLQRHGAGRRDRDADHDGADDGEGARRRGRGHRGARGGQEKLAARLELDEAQRDQLAKATKELRESRRPSPEAKAERRAQLAAAAASFAGSSFDARTSPLVAAQNEQAASRLDGRVAKLRALLSVLRPEQATKLASLLAEPKREGRGRRGRRGRGEAPDAAVD